MTYDRNQTVFRVNLQGRGELSLGASSVSLGVVSKNGTMEQRLAMEKGLFPSALNVER